MEIQVGRSDWPAGRDFKTLVYTVILMTAAESSAAKNTTKTQMFSSGSELTHQNRSDIYLHMSHDIRKRFFCICENKDADQLRGNHEADQRLCFSYISSTIPLLPKYKISSL